jgi:aryl-alcohol dehydrogenase (NADP+)
MKFTRMGSTGTQVSRLCLGCMSFGGMADWTLNEEASLPIITKAVEAGINFFDTADIYSRGQSEEILGRGLKALGVRRDEAVIATKVFNPMGRGPNRGGLSRKHISQSIDASLTRLGLDYVDLYQIHRFDYETPIEETLEALNDVVRAGKARYIGASSMYAWQFMKMLTASRANGWTPFVSMQPQYNLVYREEEREMLPLCKDQGIGVIPWSPLARGFLAGGRGNPGEGNTERARTDEFSPRLYYKAPDHAVVDKLSVLARERGVSNMQLALAWVLKNPTITSPIIGASKPHHLDDALAGLTIKLTDDEVKALEAPYEPKRVLDHA